jgi:hypothetical protein
VGIAVACVVVGVGVGVAIVFFVRRRRPGETADPPPEYSPDQNDQEVYGKQELDASAAVNPRHEMDGAAIEYFKPDMAGVPDASPLTPPTANPVYEMIGDSAVLSELPDSSPRTE